MLILFPRNVDDTVCRSLRRLVADVVVALSRYCRFYRHQLYHELNSVCLHSKNRDCLKFSCLVFTRVAVFFFFSIFSSYLDIGKDVASSRLPLSTIYYVFFVTVVRCWRYIITNALTFALTSFFSLARNVSFAYIYVYMFDCVCIHNLVLLMLFLPFLPSLANLFSEFFAFFYGYCCCWCCWCCFISKENKWKISGF